MSRQLDVRPAAVLDVIGLVAESDKRGELGSFAPFRHVARCGAASDTSCNDEETCTA